MSENEEANPVGSDERDEVVLDLNFAPSWARTSPESHIQRYQNERFDDRDGDDARFSGRDRNRGRRPRGAGDESDRPRRKPERKGPPPRRDFERGPRSEMTRPASRGAVADLRGPQTDSQPFNSHPNGDRRNFRPARPETPPLPLEIRVLPEQKSLGAVIRRIQTTHRAFPLRDIAWLFLDNPASCLIRVEPLKDQQLPLFQCKVCGLPALSEEEIRAHLVNRHLDDFFDVEEVDCEPPSGTFVCVARCGLSGELLGPPNHHSFNAKVHEMLRTRYPSMSEEAYRSRIETVRESDVIEQWRQQCTKKKIYRRKGASPTVAVDAEPVPADDVADAQEPAPKAPPMERDIAELVFMREVIPEQIASVRHLICTAAVAMQTPSRPLYFALRDTLSRERRFPASLFFALRGAFRHRNLHLFRVNEPRGQDFVMLKQPIALDPAHAVQALREVLVFVNEHPTCTKAELVTGLAGADEEKVKETLVQLAWLVEKGHVVEFYNDVLSAPLEYPAFRFLPGEKQAGGAHAGGRRQGGAAMGMSGEAPKAAEKSEETPVKPEASPEAGSDPEPLPTTEAVSSEPVAEAGAEPVETPAAAAETPASGEGEAEVEKDGGSTQPE